MVHTIGGFIALCFLVNCIVKTIKDHEENKKDCAIERIKRSGGCLYENLFADDHEECGCPKCLAILEKEREEDEVEAAEWDRLMKAAEREQLSLDEWEQIASDEDEAAVLAMEEKHFS